MPGHAAGTPILGFAPGLAGEIFVVFPNRRPPVSVSELPSQVSEFPSAAEGGGENENQGGGTKQQWLQVTHLSACPPAGMLGAGVALGTAGRCLPCSPNTPFRRSGSSLRRTPASSADRSRRPRRGLSLTHMDARLSARTPVGSPLLASDFDVLPDPQRARSALRLPSSFPRFRVGGEDPHLKPVARRTDPGAQLPSGVATPLRGFRPLRIKVLNLFRQPGARLEDCPFALRSPQALLFDIACGSSFRARYSHQGLPFGEPLGATPIMHPKERTRQGKSVTSGRFSRKFFSFVIKTLQRAKPARRVDKTEAEFDVCGGRHRPGCSRRRIIPVSVATQMSFGPAAESTARRATAR